MNKYQAKRRPSGRGGAFVAENRVVIGDKDVGSGSGVGLRKPWAGTSFTGITIAYLGWDFKGGKSVEREAWSVMRGA
jgi:hypothetical protein